MSKKKITPANFKAIEWLPVSGLGDSDLFKVSSIYCSQIPQALLLDSVEGLRHGYIIRYDQVVNYPHRSVKAGELVFSTHDKIVLDNVTHYAI